MMGVLRGKLTYANVVSTLALFLVLSGGVAYAAKYVVSSNSQVAPNVIAGHKPPTGDHANIIAGSVNSKDLAPGSVNTSALAAKSVTQAQLATSSVGEAQVTGGLPCAFSIDAEDGQASIDTICGDIEMKEISGGVYCFQVPVDTFISGLNVTLDSGSPGWPVAYSSTNPAEVTALGCPAADNAAVTTYAAEHGAPASESYSVIVY